MWPESILATAITNASWESLYKPVPRRSTSRRQGRRTRLLRRFRQGCPARRQRQNIITSMCIVLISLMHGRFADLYGGISAMPQVIAQPLSNHDCGQENAHLAAITKPTHRENPKNDTSCHPQPEHHPVLILQQQSLLCCRSLRLQTKQTVSGITPILLIRRFSHAYPACGCSRKEHSHSQEMQECNHPSAHLSCSPVPTSPTPPLITSK